MRVIGSDNRKAHGLAPQLAIADEPGAMERQSRRRHVRGVIHGAGQAAERPSDGATPLASLLLDTSAIPTRRRLVVASERGCSGVTAALPNTAARNLPSPAYPRREHRFVSCSSFVNYLKSQIR